jgi:FkbM family methyltransferase
MLYTPRLFRDTPVLKRLIPSVLKRYARLCKHRYVVERRLGIAMLLDQRNSVDRNLLLKGVWEPAQLARLTALARQLVAGPGGARVFLDIGAHWGLYSILMRKTGAFERVIAFEPEPVNLAQLAGNLFVNEMVGHIELHPVALSDHDDTLTIVAGPASNRGSAQVASAMSPDTPAGTPVRCYRLDSLVTVSDCRCVIKIDVEGHEPSVLAGMQRLLRDNRCVLQIESFSPLAQELPRLLGSGYRHLGSIGNDHYFSNTDAIV